MEEGFVIKVLFDIPGFSLIYAWFKPARLVAVQANASRSIQSDLTLGTIGDRSSFDIGPD